MALADLHPNAADLEALALGTLDGAALTAIELHVADCPACQERAAAAPADSVVELLRRAHARAGGKPDTVVDAAALLPTTAPLTVAAEAPTLPAHGRAAAPAPADSAATPAALPPELTGHERYRIQRLLGAGGMGAVYQAEHRVMQRPVAIKVIKRAFTDSPEAVERFRREVRAAARLAHPNIVTAYDAEAAGDTHFLVMEYVEGVSLGRLVRERGPLAVAEACDCVRQAALGLRHAHERGMVHRDVKPDNLIRCPDGTVKVLDFGLAFLAAERDGGLTGANVAMGTPDYIAPEQAEDAHRADGRADVYSLGCTLYHLLTGRVPFPGGSTLSKLDAHRTRAPEPAARRRPDLPAGLAAVLAKMMAKDPARRYQSAAEVADALEPFTRPAPGRPHRRRRLPVAAAALLLGLGLLAAGAVYRILTDSGELVVTTESDDVEVAVKQGGKVVRVIDTKTNKEVVLTLRSGTYELELQGPHEGLKLSVDRATLLRGEKVLARIERVARPAPTPEPPAVAAPTAVELVRRFPVSAVADLFYCTAVSPGGKYALVTRDVAPGVRVDVFDVATGEEIFDCTGYVAEFLNEEQFVVDADGMFRVYQARTGKVVREGKHPAFWGMFVAPGGRHLIFNGPQGMFLYDLVNMKVLHGWAGEFGGDYGVFSPDGKRLLVRLKVPDPTHYVAWDVEANEPAKDWQLEGVTQVYFFFPDGKTAAAVWKGELVRLQLSTGKVVEPVQNLPTPGAIQGTYARDGRCFLVRFNDGRVQFYRTPFGGKELGRYQLPEDDHAPPRSGTAMVALSPDNRFATVLTPKRLYVLRLPALDGVPGPKP